jgi:class 3 adenylate cyclase
VADLATITIVFTDVVGSTAMASAVSQDEAEELRQTHLHLLEEAVGGTGGEVVKNLGDGLMVAYRSTLAAVEAALAMQDAFAEHNRRNAGPPLRIRVGISAGDALCEHGDWFGAPVVEAARLCAEAVGGQVLAAEFVRALAGGQERFVFTNVGALELKGLIAPLPSFEVTRRF